MKLFAANKGRLNRGKKKDDETESKGASRPAGWHRMQSDMANLELPDNVKMELPDKEDFMNFFVEVTPEDGYWGTATFKFKFTVPGDYPYTPPKITCLDKIYHPNIDLQGAVCLNILRKDWKPVLDTQAVIHGLIFLFLEPNPDDPLNDAAASVLRKDKRQFAQFVDKSLKGQAVNGESFPRNKTYKR